MASRSDPVLGLVSVAAAHSSIVFCNAACADRIGMAASRLLGAAAACTIIMILSFAAESRESHRSVCIKVATDLGVG